MVYGNFVQISFFINTKCKTTNTAKMFLLRNGYLLINSNHICLCTVHLAGYETTQCPASVRVSVMAGSAAAIPNLFFTLCSVLLSFMLSGKGPLSSALKRAQKVYLLVFLASKMWVFLVAVD
jgi:hypothetical protein